MVPFLVSDPRSPSHGSFRKFGVPYFGVLIIRILLFRVLYIGVPYFRKLPNNGFPGTIIQCDPKRTLNPTPAEAWHLDLSLRRSARGLCCWELGEVRGDPAAMLQIRLRL